jgi:hypothetical protein
MPNLLLYNAALQSIKGCLQSKWAADVTLCVLHPASRFYTGRVPDVTGADKVAAVTPMPYTRLVMPSGTRGDRTSDTNYSFQMLKLHLWTDTAEEADAIADAIIDCYADAAFTYDSGRVIDTHYDGTTQRQVTQANYTAWETIVNFTMQLVRNRTN